MIASVGAGLASQLYRSLSNQGTSCSTSFDQTLATAAPPPSDKDAGSDATVSAASAKAVADLRSLLLGVQDGSDAVSSAQAGTSGTRTAAAAASNDDPATQLATDLASLLGDLKKSSHGGHHHRPGPPSDAGGPGPGTADLAVNAPDSQSQSRQQLLAALGKGLSAYAATLGAPSTASTASSA